MKKRILVSWIGHKDVTLMKKDSNEETAALVEKRIPAWFHQVDTTSVKLLLDTEQWDSVHLLSNYGEELDLAYKKWIHTPASIHSCDVPDPYDYARVFDVTAAMLQEITSQYPKNE